MGQAELEKLPNIGAVVAGQLVQVGIDTPEKLAAVGPRQAWLRIQKIDPSACYNRLCGLVGAVQGVRWHTLPEEEKEELRAFYQKQKGAGCWRET